MISHKISIQPLNIHFNFHQKIQKNQKASSYCQLTDFLKDGYVVIPFKIEKILRS